MDKSRETPSAGLAQTQQFWQRYVGDMTEALHRVEAQQSGALRPFAEVLETVRQWLRATQAAQRTIYLVGNGGSAGMASHMAVDFWKNGGVRAATFNDSAQLTCLANDLTYEEGFAAGLRCFGNPGDILIGISCSGRSENVVRAARAAQALEMKVITCTGFDPQSPLRQLADLSFYVPSYSYGITETLHQFILHAMLDVKMYCDDQRDIFHRND